MIPSRPSSESGSSVRVDSLSNADLDEIWRVRADAYCPDGQNRELVKKPDIDFAPGTRHFGVRISGALAAVVTLVREPLQGVPADVPHQQQWQFRMLAVDPAQQGAGLARVLLGHVTRLVADEGGGVLWGNMRQSAWSFYEHLGFVWAGEPYPLAPVGTPHRFAYLRVPQTGTTSSSVARPLR